MAVVLWHGRNHNPRRNQEGNWCKITINLVIWRVFQISNTKETLEMVIFSMFMYS